MSPRCGDSRVLSVVLNFQYHDCTQRPKGRSVICQISYVCDFNGFDDFVFVNPSDTLKNGQSRVSLDVSRVMIPKPSIRSIYLEILSLERWTMMIRDAEITDARELLAVMAQIDSETAFMLFEEGERRRAMRIDGVYHAELFMSLILDDVTV